MDIDGDLLAHDGKSFDGLVRDDDSASKSKQYFTTIQLLKMFRKHIAVAPRDLAEMRQHWAKTYRGQQSARPGRFSLATQQSLNENWNRLEAHAGEIHSGLVRLSRDIETEAREAWRDVSTSTR
ncbi:uncharacterized protein B0I36DRAFT_126299 [Microdochium trichocladiopsis]|uniref:Uncharacterized protein n=1 Tax=Microdochium trichocladiopsis TaxID=1682393 RepID=A0A9P8Y314_9PEZI|nr:uncharacterized protein B0I36DRAFT_126299 [Microdochium trichocladiopsis]KAH7028803.1 hypothetical protein B0I36DRAFT_126299 [Microdochium trichocladiopsis]